MTVLKPSSAALHKETQSIQSSYSIDGFKDVCNRETGRAPKSKQQKEKREVQSLI